MRNALSRPAARRSLLPFAMAACLALSVAPPLASPAFAQDATEAEIAAARQLFKDAKALETEGKWDEAIAIFKKVSEVKMTPQVRFHIALCDEHLGHLVAAINGFELAAEEARRAGASAEDVAENAPQRAKALRERVPTLEIFVTGEVLTSKVLLDGTAVSEALLGTKIPIDPGAHEVVVDTDGAITFRKRLTLEERGSETVTVEIHDVEKPAEAPPPEAPKVALPPPSMLSGRMPAVIAGGVGILSLAGAGVFFGLRESTIADVRAGCGADDKGCDPALSDTASQGQTYTTVGNVLLGVGAAGLVTGGVLWFVLAPKDDAKAASVGVAPTLGGVSVAGRF